MGGRLIAPLAAFNTSDAKRDDLKLFFKNRTHKIMDICAKRSMILDGSGSTGYLGMDMRAPVLNALETHKKRLVN
jgi:hypothetical protein